MLRLHSRVHSIISRTDLKVCDMKNGLINPILPDRSIKAVLRSIKLDSVTKDQLITKHNKDPALIRVQFGTNGEIDDKTCTINIVNKQICAARSSLNGFPCSLTHLTLIGGKFAQYGYGLDQNAGLFGV